MPPTRFVITGMGAVSALGVGVRPLAEGLRRDASGVRVMEEWASIRGLESRLAAPVEGFDPREHLPRTRRRTMGPMAAYAAVAAREAALMAGLGDEELAGGRTGVVMGSTTGSPSVYEDFYRSYLPDETVEDVRSGTFFRIMGHTTAANVSQTLGITGEQWSPSSACTTSAQAVGLAMLLIGSGRQDIVVCGGADEVHPTVTMIFDVLGAGAKREGRSPAPFDRNRDGVVCGGGAGVLVLESLESARRRGAGIIAEVLGFGHVTDTGHIANPDAAAMEACIARALEDAGVRPDEVDFVSAHATGTAAGDVAEARAIAGVLGGDVPVASHKGHLGHTLAAAGALETIAALTMMDDGVLLPTLNLEETDPECAVANCIARPAETSVATVLKNSFALGGVNTSLVLRKWQ